MDLDLQGRLAAVETMLRGDPRLDGVTITTDLDPPTSDQMPHVAVRAAGWSDDPRYLTGGLGSAGAYDATVRFDLVCWVVSGQSTGDAVRQRNTWINTLRNVVLDNANLSGSFNWLVMVGGELDEPTAEGGHYARGVLRLESRAIA